MPKTMLVTGATGKTGHYTVPLLIERGHHVRAFVHRLDARSEALASMGAEIVSGDLRDLKAVGDALAGVQAAYFCYPIEPGLIEATTVFAQAAREANVGSIVNMSQISARRDAESDAARQHWLAERVFDWSGIPVTHLRPTFFAEWLTMRAQSVATTGVLALPFGDGRHAPIAADDQAHVIAAILADPEPHAGKTYPLFGPVEMNHYEIAAEMTRALNRTISYEPIMIEAFAARLAEGGMPAHLIQHLENVAVDYRAGRFAGHNDIVEQVGGVSGTTVAQFANQHRSAFGA